MALASAYAISGLSQTEFCSSIYGTLFQEDPVQVLPLSECIPPDLFLNRWIWSDLSSESILLIPLEARISDVKRADAQLARDQDRAVRHHPPRWQDVTLRFAAKVLHLSGKSFGERGHYERLLHERHWTIGHNACKGARADLERTSLLTCKLCASDMTAADDTYDHTRSCVRPEPSLTLSCSQYLSSPISTAASSRFSSVLCKKSMVTVSARGTGTRPRSPILIKCSFLRTQWLP